MGTVQAVMSTLRALYARNVDTTCRRDAEAGRYQSSDTSTRCEQLRGTGSKCLREAYGHWNAALRAGARTSFQDLFMQRWQPAADVRAGLAMAHVLDLPLDSSRAECVFDALHHTLFPERQSAYRYADTIAPGPRSQRTDATVLEPIRYFSAHPRDARASTHAR